MKGTKPFDNDDIRSLGLEGGSNFRWQYKGKVDQICLIA